MSTNKILLQEYVDLEYDKNIIREQIEKHEPIMLKGVIQRAQVPNANHRIYPKHILEREINNYQRLVKENRAVGQLDHPNECFCEQSQLLTTYGWKYGAELVGDEDIFTLNVETNEIEIQKINHKVEYAHNDIMYHIYNEKSYDMMVTSNHRVLLWDRKGKPQFVTAEDIYKLKQDNSSWLSHAYIKSGGKWQGDNQEFFTIPDSDIQIKTELWAAFFGIWLAEGSVQGSKRKTGYSKYDKGVSISQSKSAHPDTWQQIHDLLEQLPFTYKKCDTCFAINHKELHQYLSQFGNSYTKYIPDNIKQWSPKLLNILVTWMLMGDGKNRKAFNAKSKPDRKIKREYCTTSTQLARDVEEVFLKLGSNAAHYIYTQVDRPIEGDRWILAENSKPMHIIAEKTTKTISLDARFMHIDKVNYSGKVYCVSVPNQTFLMKRNEKACWTGNSVVELQYVSHIIKKLWWEGDAVMGSIEVLNTPNGKILQSLVESDVKIGISSRGVGSLKEDGENSLVEDDFVLVCFDIVSDPSTSSAFLMKEHKLVNINNIMQQFTKADRLNRILNNIIK